MLRRWGNDGRFLTLCCRCSGDRRTVEEALSPEPQVTGQWKEGLEEGLVPQEGFWAKETHVTMTRTRWPHQSQPPLNTGGLREQPPHREIPEARAEHTG